MNDRAELSERLARHVRCLAHEIGERNVWRPRALQAAADYVRSEWTAQGYVVESQSYEVGDLQCANLEISLRNDRAAPLILIGAHYDSVQGSPGANDNGSGVAALLELSRLLADEAARNVRFVAFANEEPPFFGTRLQGSEQYAERARRQGTAIELMIALETLGSYSTSPGSQGYPPLLGYFYPDRANFVAMVSNLRSASRLRSLVKAFRESTELPVQHLAFPPFLPALSWSDHRAFWRRGYRAVMVTDTAFYRYPYYHTALDTAEHVCCGELADVTLGLAGAVRRLVRRARLPPF